MPDTIIPCVPKLRYASGGWHILVHGLRLRRGAYELCALILPENDSVPDEEQPDIGPLLDYITDMIGYDVRVGFYEREWKPKASRDLGWRMHFFPQVLDEAHERDPEAGREVGAWNAAVKDSFLRDHYPDGAVSGGARRSR